MTSNERATENLLKRAAASDTSAITELMNKNRSRLRRMVSVRMDDRLAARVDPSDVVQEALFEATRRLDEYLQDPRIAFYPWLRDIAMNRLIDLHRRHIKAQRRSVVREDSSPLAANDASREELVGRLVSSATSPSKKAQAAEVRKQLHEALDRLPQDKRDVLVLKYLEGLTAAEIADVLHLAERTVWSKHREALDAIRRVMGTFP